DFETQHMSRIEQAPGVLPELEDAAAIAALAFEHRAGIMHGMRQHVEPRLAPRHHRAVVPDEAVAIVKRNQFHRSWGPALDLLKGQCNSGYEGSSPRNMSPDPQLGISPGQAPRINPARITHYTRLPADAYHHTLRCLVFHGL